MTTTWVYTQHRVLTIAISIDDPVRHDSGTVRVLWLAHEFGRSESHDGSIDARRDTCDSVESAEIVPKRNIRELNTAGTSSRTEIIL